MKSFSLVSKMSSAPYQKSVPFKEKRKKITGHLSTEQGTLLKGIPFKKTGHTFKKNVYNSK